MTSIAKKDDPKLWEAVKHEVTERDKGGKSGQWSARKAQLATSEYKSKGGGYEGKKDPDNHLTEWTREEWGTKTGETSEETGERYLPRSARDALTDEEYGRTTLKKRSDTRGGKQFSAQPDDVARKTAPHRESARVDSKAELMERARARNIAGRSRMTKAELARALGST
jgi:hypothetical protein